jgi:hypothetical protein
MTFEETPTMSRSRNETPNPNLPIRRFTDGKHIEAAVWERVEDGQVYHKVSLSKSYYDQRTGQWQRTATFTHSELRRVVEVAEKAHQFVIERRQELTRKNAQRAVRIPREERPRSLKHQKPARQAARQRELAREGAANDQAPSQKVSVETLAKKLAEYLDRDRGGRDR